MTYINNTYVLQAIPIQYPTSTNYNIKLYVFPIICVDGYTQTHSNNTNTFIITQSIIRLSQSPGPTSDNDIYIWIVIILLRVDIGILISNDASTKIKSQDINITDNSGYKFTTGSPISTVYTGDDDSNFAIITLLNKIIIRGLGGALFGGTTGPVRVYYI